MLATARVAVRALRGGMFLTFLVLCRSAPGFAEWAGSVKRPQNREINAGGR